MTSQPDQHLDDSTATQLSEEAVDEAVTKRLARRPWPTTPLRSAVEVSFEFFPTKTPSGAAKLEQCATQLAAVNPTFFSVTYGAGGTDQQRTHATIAAVHKSTAVDVAGHLTCVNATRDQVNRVLDRYRNVGVRRIVALRGDSPAGTADDPPPDSYRDAIDLVTGIRSRDDGASFDISVAAYPEVHPKAQSAAADLDNLKRKLDAGADRAITQFFFDTDAFLRFQDRARSAGISEPIVPGIMPITNFANVAGFATRCGTSIPSWMPDLFGGLDESPEIQNLIAATVAAEQCRRLSEHGVTKFHFYTMNRPELSLAVCRTLGLHSTATDTRQAAVS